MPRPPPRAPPPRGGGAAAGGPPRPHSRRTLLLATTFLTTTALKNSFLADVTGFSSPSDPEIPPNVPQYTATLVGGQPATAAEKNKTSSRLDLIKDYQPFDTLIGQAIQSRFVEQPSAAPPPTQAALDLAYGCPTTLLPKHVVVNAPTGCSSTALAGGITNSTGTDVLQYESSCFSFNKPTMTIRDAVSQVVVTQAWTKNTLWT